jgi:hypothetical protein
VPNRAVLFSSLLPQAGAQRSIATKQNRFLSWRSATLRAGLRQRGTAIIYSLAARLKVVPLHKLRFRALFEGERRAAIRASEKSQRRMQTYGRSQAYAPHGTGEGCWLSF